MCGSILGWTVQITLGIKVRLFTDFEKKTKSNSLSITSPQQHIRSYLSACHSSEALQMNRIMSIQQHGSGLYNMS